MPPSGGDDRDRLTPDERLAARLRDLDKRLEAGKKERGPLLSEAEQGRRSSALGKAFRLSTELVAGVFVGGLIGWLLDRWFGTLSLFLVIFLLLGIAAGLTNAIRSARQMGEK